MNEEFVPFELAKKLQEKGFDWQTFDWYDHLGNFNKGFIPRTLRGCPMHREYYAPTIGLAMKWLREEKKIHIKVDLYYDGWDTLIYTDLHTDDIGEYKYNYCIDRGDLSRSTYEKTVLDSIEYIIDNLI